MPTESKIETRQVAVQATVRANSYNPETRTLTVDFASEFPVSRYSWTNDEEYLEVLEMSTKAANLDRLNRGAAVLIGHNRYDSDKVVGTTLRAWVDEATKVASAELKLSGRASLEEFRQDVADGIWNNISFGYVVTSFERTQEKTDKKAKYIAKGWEAREISFEAIPADYTVGVRSAPDDKERTYQAVLIDQSTIESEMKLTTEGADPTNQEGADDSQRGAPDAGAIRKAAEQAVKDERVRASGIKEATRAAGLEDSFAENLISEGTTIDQARALIIEEFAKQSPTRGIAAQHTARVSGDEKDKERSLMATAMAVRSGNVSETKFDKAELQAANKYRAHGLMGMARLSLEDAGIRTYMMSPEEIAKRAITQSTGDFPNLLGQVIHLVKENAYEEIGNVWPLLAKVGSVGDFRDHKDVRSWGLDNLPKVGETEEYKNIPLVDGDGEAVRVFKYGAIINLSWEAIVNDNLGAFTDLASRLVQSYERTKEDVFFDLVNFASGAGPNLADGNALFSAAHNNIINPAVAYGNVSLEAMRLKLAFQKDGGGRLINFQAHTLLTNTVNELVAKQYNEEKFIVDVANGKNINTSNTSRGLVQRIVTSPRLLSTTASYMLANPQTAPVWKMHFLDGQQQAKIERYEEFRTDGVNWKVRGVFGANAVSHRPGVYNPGV